MKIIKAEINPISYMLIITNDEDEVMALPFSVLNAI